jgi:flagellar P-ring protein precursor FlgI
VRLLLLVLLLFQIPHVAFSTPVRIKDLANFDGVRGNDLVGYGLVVGLDGTGDGFRNSPFTEEMLAGLLERLGTNVSDDALRAKNVAAVIVTATLPPFARSGSRIDVGVSAIGDANSLLGGTLVMTPLKAADGEIYAVAQGSLIASGVAVSGEAARVTEGVPTSGRIPLGARVEREVQFDFVEIETIRLALRNADFTTAVAIENAINDEFATSIATAIDGGTILVAYKQLGAVNPAHILSQIENLGVVPNDRAKVVIDHRSGTIVLGADVRISRVAEAPIVSQPNPFTFGETVVVPRSAAEIQEQSGTAFAVVGAETDLQILINGLNSLGVHPRGMIDLLKSIHSAGALHADLIIE